MMEAQHFNLSWVEFENTALIVDVTLACEDGNQINAHKVLVVHFSNKGPNNIHERALGFANY